MRLQKRATPNSYCCPHLEPARPPARRANPRCCSTCLKEGKKQPDRLFAIHVASRDLDYLRFDKSTDYLLKDRPASDYCDSMPNQLEVYKQALSQNKAPDGTVRSQNPQDTHLKLKLGDAAEEFDWDSLDYTVPEELKLSLSEIFDKYPSLVNPSQALPSSQPKHPNFSEPQYCQMGSMGGQPNAFSYPIPQAPFQAQPGSLYAVNAHTGLMPYFAGVPFMGALPRPSAIQFMEGPSYIGPNYSSPTHTAILHSGFSASSNAQIVDCVRTPNSSTYSYQPNPDLQRRGYEQAGEEIRGIFGSQPTRAPVQVSGLVTYGREYKGVKIRVATVAN
ncbi:hypothetical protein Hte_006563 [Hypoxylon texense]